MNTRAINFSPRRSPHSCADKGNGPSPLRNDPAIPTPLVAPARNNTGSAAPISAAPSKWDIAFAAFVFACFAVAALCFYGLGALGELIVGRWLAARRWIKFHRVCSWCQHTMGGNPLSREITNGICPTCLAIQKSQIARARSMTFTRTN